MKNKKRLLFEVILVLIIIIQSVCLLVFTKFQGTIESLLDIDCMQTLGVLEHYQEKGKHYAVIKIGEHFLSCGIEDRFIFHKLGESYFASNDKLNALKYLKLADQSKEYYCELVSPGSAKMQLFDDAMLKFQLSQLYEELGSIKESEQSLKSSHSLLQKFWGQKYSLNNANTAFENVSLYRLRS